MNSNLFAAPLSKKNDSPAAPRISLTGWVVIACVCVISIGFRLIDFSFGNLSTIVALSLFCGTVFRNRTGWLLPLGVRLLTDIAIHLKTGYGFFPSWPFDYSAYLLIFALGMILPAARKCSTEKRIVAVLGTSIGSVLIYFVLSNFGVWLLWPDTYPRTPAGLIDCFINALPFARGTIVGNLLAAPVFYGMWYAFASRPEEVSTTASLATADK